MRLHVLARRAKTLQLPASLDRLAKIGVKPMSGGSPPKMPLDKYRYNDYLYLRMVGRLQAEIKQKKRIQTVEQEAFLNLQRTADFLLRGVEAALKPAGLSHTQYNALRILRGAGSNGLSCREVADRMLTRDPDITRLLDRLETRRLVARSRERTDRRVITTRITRDGLEILKKLDKPILDVHQGQLRHLGDRQLRKLINLLELARGG